MDGVVEIWSAEMGRAEQISREKQGVMQRALRCDLPPVVVYS
jgi:hypothetical protein